MHQQPLLNQDKYLSDFRDSQTIVTLILKGGIPIQGIIRTCDAFVVVIEDSGNQYMVYKHANSTVLQGKIPTRQTKSDNTNSRRKSFLSGKALIPAGTLYAISWSFSSQIHNTAPVMLDYAAR